MNGIIRNYSELMRIESYEERFEYLALNGTVARPTFGNERWMNQRFYHSKEWYDVRFFYELTKAMSKVVATDKELAFDETLREYIKLQRHLLKNSHQPTE